ncbi:MFS transporter [Paractinoplanes abujensis]|uniref:EmrB/QacA subfamily drug resistance transporter n=1 Tax=Paractinoplanes abujensis TaxID=882441 RepID=A0A7W7CLU7_9ACTN|nr:MDR family MFS transporter [Actinoplanes abujensis]MBB4690872.1 EmrB/QacA subfamily drug resistance transporter [Actinoplanes abujensis]GID17715.1 MFS transporter [Actinoplanes abujensis]
MAIERQTLRTSLAVLTGGVAVILDSTIVSVALHELAADLGAGVGTIQWVSTAYLLALGVVIPTVGWLQGRLGAKRLWLAALTLFLLGSVLCSFAWDAPSLIAFRVVQGLGGGVMMPLMTTMIVQAASAADRTRLMTVVALPTAIAPVLGPVAGGLILGAGDWRWLFLVNVPICLAGLVLAARWIPAGEPGRRVRLDVVGLLLMSPALVALLWGLSNVGGGNDRTDVLLPLIGGALLLAAFVLWALRRRDDALVDLGVLRSRPTWAASTLMFLSGASLYGAMLLLPLYWQQVRGEDALGAGLLLIPQGLGSLLSRTAAARLVDRVGARGVSILGFVLVGLATVPFAYAGEHTATWPLLAALFARGLGLGMVIIPLMTVAFTGLEHARIPHASIVTRVAQQVGGSAGVALLAVVLSTASARTGNPVHAFDLAFWWTVGFTGLAVLVSFVLPGQAAQDVPAVASEPVVSSAR